MLDSYLSWHLVQRSALAYYQFLSSNMICCGIGKNYIGKKSPNFEGYIGCLWGSICTLNLAVVTAAIIHSMTWVQSQWSSSIFLHLALILIDFGSTSLSGREYGIGKRLFAWNIPERGSDHGLSFPVGLTRVVFVVPRTPIYPNMLMEQAPTLEYLPSLGGWESLQYLTREHSSGLLCARGFLCGGAETVHAVSLTA